MLRSHTTRAAGRWPLLPQPNLGPSRVREPSRVRGLSYARAFANAIELQYIDPATTMHEAEHGMAPILDERAALLPAQGVLLWSMRAWVLGLMRSTDMGARIRGAFAGVDAAEAAAGLSGFMEALDEGGIRTVDVGRMCDPKISADERLLLGAFASVQAGRTADAARVLRGMAAARSVAVLLDRAEDVASALMDAGLVLLATAPAASRVTVASAALH